MFRVPAAAGLLVPVNALRGMYPSALGGIKADFGAGFRNSRMFRAWLRCFRARRQFVNLWNESKTRFPLFHFMKQK